LHLENLPKGQAIIDPRQQIQHLAAALRQRQQWHLATAEQCLPIARIVGLQRQYSHSGMHEVSSDSYSERTNGQMPLAEQPINCTNHVD
jgi:hypothetical protein